MPYFFFAGLTSDGEKGKNYKKCQEWFDNLAGYFKKSIKHKHLLIIYQIGIFLLYQSGIILSSKKGKVFDMKLQELRKAKGMSQVRLAIELDLNQNTISRYEKGEREADYATLIKIADYFNVSIDYLLGRTNNPQINR